MDNSLKKKGKWRSSIGDGIHSCRWEQDRRQARSPLSKAAPLPLRQQPHQTAAHPSFHPRSWLQHSSSRSPLTSNLPRASATIPSFSLSLPLFLSGFFTPGSIMVCLHYFWVKMTISWFIFPFHLSNQSFFTMPTSYLENNQDVYFQDACASRFSPQ